jgi:hypothetical protein
MAVQPAVFDEMVVDLAREFAAAAAKAGFILRRIRHD